MQSISKTSLSDSLLHFQAVSDRKLPVTKQLWAREDYLKKAISYIEKTTKISMNYCEVELLLKAAKHKTFKRRHILLQQGDICQHIYFVVAGALRLYSVNERGREAIISFGIEHEWLTDRESVSCNIPSAFTIDAVEDAEVLQFDAHQLEELSYVIPAVAELIRLQAKAMAIFAQKRISSVLSMTAEERYENFMICQPQYANRFSQTMVASYLGLQQETVSRIRQRCLRKHYH